MTDKELEIQRIVEQHKVTEYRGFHYEGLPSAENVIPLTKYPEQTTMTEKIGNTEYTVNAHFRQDGNDLLYHLCTLLLYGVNPHLFYEE